MPLECFLVIKLDTERIKFLKASLAQDSPTNSTFSCSFHANSPAVRLIAVGDQHRHSHHFYLGDEETRSEEKRE